MQVSSSQFRINGKTVNIDQSKAANPGKLGSNKRAISDQG
jgi:hypothetical protein